MVNVAGICNKYRPDIDGLRAIAVLAVLAFHAFPSVLQGGFIGVDIFFVISGYLISNILFAEIREGRFSILEFYSRRIRRIFPALLVVVFSAMLVGCLVLLADEYAQLGKHIISASLFLSNFLLYSESGYFDTAASVKPLLHLWSLAVEEQFYLLWPALLLFVHPRSRRYGPLLLFCGALSFVANIYLAQFNPTAAFYWPIGRFWELMIGGGIANIHAVGRKMSPAQKGAIALLGGALVVVGLLVIDGSRVFPGWWAVFPVLGAALIIFAGPDAWLNKYLLSRSLLVRIGLFSYPLYLWHWLLLSIAYVLDGDGLSLTIRWGVVAGSVLLAWLTYSFVERPLRHSTNPHLPYYLLAGMLLMGLAGGGIVLSGGFPGRPHLVSESPAGELLTAYPIKTRCERIGVDGGEQPTMACEYVDNGAQKAVAIYGDSHAYSAFAGIAANPAFKRFNLILLSSAGCPQLLNAYVGDTANARERCESNTRQAMRVIQAERDIEMVLMFSRGPAYVTGQNLPWGGEAKVFTKAQLSVEELGGALQATIDRFVQSGVKVYYVSENPELEFDPVRCRFRPFQLGQKNCTLAYSRVVERQHDYRAMLDRLRHVGILNALEIFCPEGKCRVTDGRGVFYTDNNHLSPLGSQYQANALGALLFGSPNGGPGYSE